MSASLQDDRAARARALDTRQSFIVQAPAGSGKTELLTQRFLALLACVEAPEEVLALTFTRKAAGEMRERILLALDLAAAPPDDDEPPHRRQTRELARAVLEADRAHGWSLRRHPARLRVMTLDALCAALARRMPVLSGFGAAPRIVEDAWPLYREAARLTIAEVESGEEWSAAIACLLRHLDNNLATVENLIAGMLANRDQWQRHAIDIDRADLEAALAAVVGDALATLADAFPDDVATTLVPVLAYAADNLARQGVELAALPGLRAGRLPDAVPAALPAWVEIAGLMLTKSGQWRSRLTVNEGFPAKGAGVDAAQKAYFQQMKDEMSALLDRFSTDEALLRHLAGVMALPPPHYTDRQWEMLAALSELLKIATAMLEVIFRGRGESDFPRVARAALDALGEEDRPTDLALQLDYRIRHILVDEFQDTSLGQYRLLERLTAGWEPGDGRTLFVVGDPMQSIYRFREAEVGLYLQAREQGIGMISLESLRLVVNYRSQAGIIDWVNEAFARVLPSTEDITRGAVSYSPALAHHPGLDGQAVTVHPLLGSDVRAEAGQVVDLVDAALADGAGGTVALLVRTRTHLAEIVPLLRQAGHSFRAVEIEHLAHRPVIQDLLALTAALTHPGDRLAWLAVLRAPWCGLLLDDLHALVEGAPDEPVWTLINDGQRTSRLSADGQRRLAQLRQVLGAALATQRRRSLRRQVEGVWLALGGPACIDQPGDLEDAGVFLDLLDATAAGADLVDRQMLMQRLDRLYARPDTGGNPRLQIMTIHRAKGLEFDTVIVPGLGRPPRSSEARLLMWLERPQGGLLLGPIRASDTDEDQIYQYIAGIDREKSLLEDGRLLYVAATRARRRLHLVATVATDDHGGPRQPPKTSLLARLWPVVEPAFLAAVVPEAAGQADVADAEAERGLAQSARTIRRLVADWRLPAPPSPLVLSQAGAHAADLRVLTPPEFLWAGEMARHIGTVTHALLQQCARSGVIDADRLDPARLHAVSRIALSRQGVPEPLLAEAGGRVVAAVQGTLADPRGRWILAPDHQDARCEYALSTRGDHGIVTVVIDRCFVDAEGVRWIIDYKTGSHEGGGVEAFLDAERDRYRAQLEGYAAIMSRRETRPIRLGLYFPLLRGWREWAWAP